MIVKSLTRIPAMSGKRFVWFVLVDGQGNAFDGTTASSVYIPSNYVIDQFKKEVKVEYDRYGDELAGIQPSKLLVYEDRAALDDRRFLKSSAPLVTLGINEENALLVVVPSHELIAPNKDYPAKKMKMNLVPRAEWFTSELIVFCSVELSLDEWLAMTYNGTFQNLILNDNDMEENAPQSEARNYGSSIRPFQRFEINFPVLMHDNRPSKVFVRPCYNELFKLLLKDIEKRIQSVGITGNPGVGKSRVYS